MSPKRKTRWRRGLGVVLVIASSLGSTACARAPSTAQAPRPAWVDRIAVAPVNLAVQLPEELHGGSERVWRILLERSLARSRGVAVLEASDAWELWKGVVLEAQQREISDPRTILADFARDVGEQSEFDLLLLPSLVYREARFDGSVARWDGVRRRVSHHQNAERPSPEWSMYGEITGVSLHLIVFDSKGREVARGWGGLDLVHELSLEGEGLVLRPSILDDANHLQEGVDRALDECGIHGPEAL